MKSKHLWFKHKGYLHFDFSLEKKEAEKYVLNPENILHHRFSPLIYYEKISRKVQRDKLAEQLYKSSGKTGAKPKLTVKNKSRNVFYTSHIDGYIYSYYAYELQKYYEDFLAKNGLNSHVIAYRSIIKEDIKFSNIHFSKEVFEFVAKTNGCNVLCFDISKFFDRLSVEVLKKKWAQILSVEKLPEDHFKVYKSLVDFRYVEEEQLTENFKGRFKKNPREHGLGGESGGSRKNRICNYRELRALERDVAAQGKHLFHEKALLNITGIPQGTAISGLLSNIFMLDFDTAIKQYVDDIGGLYRRYSDDICIVVPTTLTFTEVEDYVKQQLEKNCTNSIELNLAKTEKKIYQNAPQHPIVLDSQNYQPSVIQYLGFYFDGERVFIRNSSISKNRGRIVRSIRYKRRGEKINTVDVFKRYSPRIITPYDVRTHKPFVYYCERVARVHNSKAVLAQIGKNDRFINRTINRLRSKRPKR